MANVMLFYVGAVLFCNGLWLLGQIEDKEIKVIDTFVGGLGLVIVLLLLLAGTPGDFKLAAQLLLFPSPISGWHGTELRRQMDAVWVGSVCLSQSLPFQPGISFNRVQPPLSESGWPLTGMPGVSSGSCSFSC